MTTTKIESITVVGRRWFQKSAGNTYCSATIYVNGKKVGVVAPTYGYGEYYLQAAFEHLDKLGLINRVKHANGSSTAPWKYCQDNGISFDSQVFDVKREKDLDVK